MTKQRELILNILQGSDRHLSADEVFFLAKLKMPGIAMATVYNNLNAMWEAGMITRMRVDGGAVCYDKETHPHDHMMCMGCGRIQNIRLPQLDSIIEEQLGEEIDGYDLTVSYLCPACKRQAKR